MVAEAKLNIPVLTDTVGIGAANRSPGPATASASAHSVEQAFAADREMLIAELQTQIAASMFALTDDIMRTAFAEMEASVFEQISGRLRRELPELIDRLLRERIGENNGD